MSLATVKEWLNPGWVRRRTVPPMDTGLRPNLRLDDAAELLTPGEYQPDDVVLTAGGVVFSSGNRVIGGREFPGRVAALAVRDGEVLAAVDGVGIVTATGEQVCTAVKSGVTALAAAPDGSLLATIGSTREAQWARALVTGDRSGRLVRIDGGRADVVAEGLAWPSGVGVSGDEVRLSLSLEHRIEARPLGALGKRGRPVIENLPVYPGRISGDWIAAPYVRNRVTELLLDEPALLAEMTATISPDEWFVPRLHAGNPFTDTMQMGQLRVLGVVKSWAPARSCGLVFRLDESGRVAESAHARVDSPRHGVTGVAARDGRVVVTVHGNLLELRDA
ncbi:hypothetical protein [Amycolatopsis australiensis]|uniref:Strictosidine synthase n=1 Tax=Amycolatopsis australiensis TaxID=546364 RepID=A0A1K1S736_9PSEU|nr:hypothetical protein [Amycolatopsis australiensis]SFW79829.1 hypothetical protein SAMN04489730_4844 [Amycolatopsis australiensis]